ncbi:MAG TPA: LysM peptidoglycan-binding domain-containing protein, partial [Acidimicrobiales bacterium]
MERTFSSHAMSRIGSLISLLAILGLLFGVPVALAVFVGWPLPHGVPSWDEIRQAFERDGVQIEVVIKGLAVIVWIAWAQLAWAILAEAAAVARGRTARPVLALPGTQLMARRLVASAALVLSSFGSVRVANAAPLAPLQEVEQVTGPDLRTITYEVPAGTQMTTPPTTAAPGPGTSTTTSTVPPGTPTPLTDRVYEVQRGDTLWGLAEQYMGSGMRWRELRDRNVGRAVAPGRVLTLGEDHLEPGWQLVIPAGGAGVPGTAATGPPTISSVEGPLTAPPSAAPPGSELSQLPEEPQVIDPPGDGPPVIVIEAEPAPVAEVPGAPDEGPPDEGPPEEDEVAAPIPMGPIVVTAPAAPEPSPGEMTPAASAPVAAQAAVSTLMVEPGDHFWGLAERQLETAWGRSVSAEEIVPYWRNLIDANQVNIRSGNPDLIFPGEQFSAPPPPPSPDIALAPAPAPAPAPAAPSVPPTTERGQEEPPAATTTPTTETPTTTESSTSETAESTEAPTTEAPTTEAPTTQPPATEAPVAPPGPSPTGTVATTAPPTTAADTTAPPDSGVAAPPTSPGGTATVLDSMTDVQNDDEQAGRSVDDEDPFPYWLVAGSAAFAGLVLAALRRKRRARRRLAQPGDEIEGRPLEDIRSEKAYAVVAADVPQVVATVSRALGAVIASNPELPPVTAVVVSPLRT